MKIEKISKSFKGLKILKDISFDINKNEVLALIGANGSGKSTLIRILAGLIVPDEGEIKDSFKNIGVLLEGSRNIYHFLTVEENIRYFSILNNISEENIKYFMNKYLKIFKLDDKIHEKAGNLSRGMIQKLSILILLIPDFDFIIMDEPTLGLDLISSMQLREIISNVVKDRNKPALIVSHDKKLIEDLADRIILLKNGEIVFDKNIKDFSLTDCEEYIVYYKSYEEGLDNEALGEDIYRTVSKDISKLSERLGKRLIKIEKNIPSIETVLSQYIEEEDYEKLK